MKLLYRLRGWLTIREAAAHLSMAGGEKVTEADVLRLGLEKYLPLAVNFVSEAKARLGSLVPREQRTGGVYFDVSENEGFQRAEPEKIVSIDGIWDLAMIGNERGYVEQLYRTLKDVPSQIEYDSDAVFVNQPEGTWCELVEFSTLDDGHQAWIGADLPQDAVLVVRTAALDELTRRVPTSPGKEPPKPKAVGPTDARSEQPEPAATSSHMVGGSRLATWLAAEMEERGHMTGGRLSTLTGLDRKTIQKMLDGESVREVRVRKLANGLDIPRSEIPSD